jgi:tungstate transport system ATP-binding protein
MGNRMIEAHNLGQEYGGQYVLRDVNLKIEDGEVFALIGPTGAGKTTLLRLLDLLELPAQGKVYFGGIDVTSIKQERLKARRRMSFVQQKPVVFTMSVFDNVACGLRWRQENDEVIRQRVDAALELVGMTEYRDRNAKTLSGGETQRVAIARALAIQPELLLLDEPTANLDPVSVSKVEEVLEHIIGERQITVVMATHDMPQGQRLANRIGVLIKGRVLQVGTPNEIFTLPESQEVAEFVGVENILVGVVVERENGLATIELDGGRIEAISDYGIGERVYILVRPEDITITLCQEVTSARNTFSGRIVKTALVGALVRVEMDCGFPLLGLVTKRSAEELNLNPGRSICASFKASAVRTIKCCH